MRLPALFVAAVCAAGAVSLISAAPVAAAGPSPIPVTPFAGFNSLLTRAPYVTDLTQTGADVSWATTSSALGTLDWGPLGSCSAYQAPVPSSLPDSYPAAGTPPSITNPQFSVVSGTNEYQSTVVLSGLSPGTTYCYRPLATGGVDLLGSNPSQQFTTLAPVGSANPLTFDVVGDIGETLYSSTTAFPNNLNTDQAAIDSLIGSSGAQFVVTAGDVGYSGGTQANYGDLENGGSEVSDIFGPSYWPQTQGLPVFPGEGNHGQNTIGLRTWPEANTAAASGGAYAYDSYPANSQDGTNAGSYPDGWYAFSTDNVRIYVIDVAWADGSNVGTATGSACTAAGEDACPGYQVDHDVHWTTSSPEYKWLAADLASHPGTVKLAVWHYPLRSDETTQDSDVYLQNSPVNPYQSSSLESLLAANGVQVVFNGHAHDYQRISPSGTGQITNYVTGGGGGVLEPVETGSACSSFQSSGSIYAIGWSPTSSTGTACGAPTPQSAAQVYNFLKVTVSGGTMTVTPINAAGQSFDVQSYTYSTTPAVVIDTPPPAQTNSTSASIAFHASSGSPPFTCSLDGATSTSCTSPVDLTGLAEGSHTFTVAASGDTSATAKWTVDTTPPSTPTITSGTAASAYPGQPNLDGVDRQRGRHWLQRLPERSAAHLDPGEQHQLHRHDRISGHHLPVHRRRPGRRRQRLPAVEPLSGDYAGWLRGTGNGPVGGIVDDHGDPCRAQHRGGPAGPHVQPLHRSDPSHHRGQGLRRQRLDQGRRLLHLRPQLRRRALVRGRRQVGQHRDSDHWSHGCRPPARGVQRRRHLQSTRRLERRNWQIDGGHIGDSRAHGQR